MKRTRWVAAFVLPMVLLAPATAQAKAPKIVTFKNCDAMRLVYKGGVAKVGAKDKRSGTSKAKVKPYVSTALYDANKRLDRDKDGVACEH